MIKQDLKTNLRELFIRSGLKLIKTQIVRFVLKTCVYYLTINLSIILSILFFKIKFMLIIQNPLQIIIKFANPESGKPLLIVFRLVPKILIDRLLKYTILKIHLSLLSYVIVLSVYFLVRFEIENE